MLLLIPTAMIRDLIREREARQRDAITEVSSNRIEEAELKVIRS